MPAFGFQCSIGASLACAHKTLDTTLSGRHSENLRAEAQKVDQGWQVSLQLPAGDWRVQTSNEQQSLRMVPGAPCNMAQWTVAADRWATGKPFDLVLEGGEMIIPITIN